MTLDLIIDKRTSLFGYLIYSMDGKEPQSETRAFNSDPPTAKLRAVFQCIIDMLLWLGSNSIPDLLFFVHPVGVEVQ